MLREKLYFLVNFSSTFGNAKNSTNESSIYGTIINDNYYHYIKNIFGDILGLVDENGGYVADYTYDAWGNILSATASVDNSLRYKGYYYDSETDMYYCHTRYYVPKWLRWLNSDNVEYLDTNDFAGINLFVYCGNNPVIASDPDGTMHWGWKLAIGIGVIALLVIATVATGGAAGGVAGFILAGALKGAVIGAISGAVIGGAVSGITAAVKNEDVLGAVINGTADGFMSGAIIGGVTGAASNAIKVGQAASMWDKGTFKSGFNSMKYHYAEHGANCKNIVDYTKQAYLFSEKNVSLLKYTFNYKYANFSWNFNYTNGSGGMWSSIGKIITFW